ncbi:MAG: hypothetical protein HY016_04070 [Nitrosomonadales bacterium]|nr:hypothetical protein [Nitrosomonadales bacterium]
MKRVLLLFLSANHLHAQLMTGDRIALQRDFTDTAEGLTDFASFLLDAKYPTFLLADLIEEDFRLEVVPHLSGSSRTALLNRKFDQFYRNTPFRKATRLQRQLTGRRDDEMLFSALTNPALITSWLNIMKEQQTPLAGIYSVPQISAPLIKNSPSNHLLLISWEKLSGLRQTYFSEHRLQISRLTPVHADLNFQDAVVNELARTYQYLKSLSLLPPGQTLDVRILCHANDHSVLSEKLSHSTDMHFDFSDIEEAGRQFKINYRFTDSDASQIFLHQLTSKRPHTHYANAEHTRYYSLWKMRRALNWSSAMLLLSSLLWAAANLWQSTGNATETETLRTQTQRIIKEAQQITQNFPHTLVPSDDMKASVSAIRKLEHAIPAPQIFLKPISTALDHFPQIELHDLTWHAHEAEPMASGELVYGSPSVVILKGDLHDFSNDYRAALTYLDRFQLELNQHGYRSTVLGQPLDVSPAGSLADQREARENALGFSLKLVWVPSP